LIFTRYNALSPPITCPVIIGVKIEIVNGGYHVVRLRIRVFEAGLIQGIININFWKMFSRCKINIHQMVFILKNKLFLFWLFAKQV